MKKQAARDSRGRAVATGRMVVDCPAAGGGMDTPGVLSNRRLMWLSVAPPFRGSRGLVRHEAAGFVEPQLRNTHAAGAGKAPGRKRGRPGTSRSRGTPWAGASLLRAGGPAPGAEVRFAPDFSEQMRAGCTNDSHTQTRKPDRTRPCVPQASLQTGTPTVRSATYSSGPPRNGPGLMCREASALRDSIRASSEGKLANR